MRLCTGFIAMFLSSAGFACGSTAQGTKPRDMSRVEHEAAARHEEALARGHEEQAQRAAAAEATPPPERGEVLSLGQENCVPAQTVCWTSRVNPTEEHRRDAERHRTLAAKHRAASQALLAAEQRACAGINQEDRDMSPFRHTEDIVSATPLHRSEAHGKTAQSHLAGATVVFRAVPGMTEQWLERLLGCHAARVTALGHDTQPMPYCPLMVDGASGSVRAVPGGFAVNVRAEDEAAAREILARAEKLAAAQP